jgi:hypothetical protein
MRKAKTFSFRLISRRHGMVNFALSVALSIRINNEKSASGAGSTEILRVRFQPNPIIHCSHRLRHAEYFLSDSMGFAVLHLISTLTRWAENIGANAPE